MSRGKGKSAVAAAAYRSGEKLTNEWDGMTHDYTRKGGVVHTEIMLPPHAPPSFSDRATLWNSVELYEKAGNAQLAREIDAALPIELSREEQIRLVREYCSSQFVSRGMCVDFAIHDTDSGNPHCHIMLTMRPLDERGTWAAKSKKEYDLDENGERIRLPSGRYKTHKIDLTGWNDKDNTLLWRKAWADFTNDFLERNGSPERIDHRSNAERGIDEIPTVHMGVAACQMEKKGIATEKGELNRNIQKANRLIREIRAQIGKLKEWIADLFKARETAPEQPPQSPNLANLLMKYLSVQREKSRKYSQRWQQQHTADELKTIAAAVNYLSEHGISNLDELDASLSSVSDRAYSIREGMKTAEQRMKELQKLIENGENYLQYKPIHAELKKLKNGWTNKRDKYEETHRAELTLWNAASRYLHANLTDTKTLPNCVLKRLDYQQEEGLMSSVPLGVNHIPIKRALTTTSTAIFVPFTTQELFMAGESLYYGLNALSNNMIMVDRKKLKNPNGLILGTPGSGKSFAAKREITNAFFVTKDDIIIGDPEGEYYPLVHALGGQVVHISPTSKDYINPMDINMDYSDDDNPLGVKSDFVLSLCELIMGSRDGIEAEEKSVIDRCLPLVYQKYFADPKPENMPVLGDLYDCLRAQKEPQAQRIATALEIYVNGSLKVFNHRTNVELNNRIVCFDIKELGKQLKKIGMLIVQDQVWNRVTINRGIKSTRYYIDEFHLLLKEEQTAAYSVEIWKRFRKWGGVPTGITQNIKDLLASREIENIFENSDFILMLNQAAGDRQILAKQLNISPYQLSYVTNSGEGEGLLFYGTTIIPFKDKFDKSLKLYSLMTTKPEEVEKREKEMEAEKHEGKR